MLCNLIFQQILSGEKAWSKATRFVVGEDVLSKSFTGTELNKIAIKLGLPIDVAGKIAVRVESYMDHTIYSDPIVLTVTPYEKAVVTGEYIHARKLSRLECRYCCILCCYMTQGYFKDM